MNHTGNKQQRASPLVYSIRTGQFQVEEHENTGNTHSAKGYRQKWAQP